MEHALKDLELSSSGGTKKKHQPKEARTRRQLAENKETTKAGSQQSNPTTRHAEQRNDSSMLRIVDSGIITETVSNTSKKGLTDRELDMVSDELITTQETLRETEEKLHRSEALVQDLERSLQNSDKKNVLRYEAELQESREEKSRLHEEINCLRDILYVQDARGVATTDERAQNLPPGASTVASKTRKANKETKEAHQQEIELLREHIDEVLTDNTDLRSKVKRLESAIFSTSSNNMSKDERFQMQEEIYKLRDELRILRKEYESETGRQESRRKSDSSSNVDTSEDGIIGVEFAGDSTSSTEDAKTSEKLRQTETMLNESQEECSRMRSEVLSLTGSLYDTRQSESAYRTESKRLNEGLLEARVEIKDRKRQIITLENSLILTQEEVRLLSEEISYMSSAFEKAEDEYNSIVKEFEKLQNIHEASCRDAELSEKIVTEFFERGEMADFRDRFETWKEEKSKEGQHYFTEHVSLSQFDETRSVSGQEDMDLHTTSSEIAHGDFDYYNATMEALNKTDDLLRSVNDTDIQHEYNLQKSNEQFISTGEKAEEIRRKVSFLIYALQKARKDHSDVLLRLKSVEKESQSLPYEDGIIDKDYQEILYQFNVEPKRTAEQSALAVPVVDETETKKVESVAETSEIHLLRTQFEKLNEKTKLLARQVKDTESQVVVVSKKHDEGRLHAEDNAIITKELQESVAGAVRETNQRNHEVEKLATMMEDRMSGTEDHIEMLETEISTLIDMLPSTGQPESPGKHSKLMSNEWLADHYENGTDEMLKAAIAATIEDLQSYSARKDDAMATIDGRPNKIASTASCWEGLA